ncbi:hypothetical protein E2562_021387 [Oryza meyeriana var. granulata]|uniref:Uncharacterized protein n=1 Tax=Oryza meyeriana var. granulata TaxID=110450 RepID=A0A6G1EXP4_9ORYZ|nr:hypothetical protein E2562_021387 [Oryza meyeriana var. granulata]
MPIPAMDHWEVNPFRCLSFNNPPAPPVTSAPAECASHAPSSHAHRDTQAAPKIVDDPTPPSIHRFGVHAYAELRDGPAGSRRLPTPLPAASACHLNSAAPSPHL